MKIIKYQIMTEVDRGTEENPNIEQVFHDVMITCTSDNLEANVEIAKSEAYMGKNTIEDDGRPDPVAEPTADDVLNALLGVNRYA